LVFTSFFIANPVISLFFVVYFVIVIAFIQIVIGKRLQKSSDSFHQGSISVNTKLYDAFNTYREATVIGRMEPLLFKFFQAKMKVVNSQARTAFLQSLPRNILESTLFLALLIFSYFQFRDENTGENLSNLGVFLIGGLRIAAALQPFQSGMATMKTLIPQAKSVLGILQEQNAYTEKYDLKATRNHSKSKADIVFKSVSFKHEGANEASVHNISFRIQFGSQVALIGPSGAGKSTIAELLLGLLTPSTGLITIDNQIPELFRFANPGVMAYVPQETGLISGTIAENIALGIDPNDIDIDELNNAAHMANLLEFINTLPADFSTNLGKHSEKISGGQLQRIGLARAFYGNPTILVMDEATSGLDGINESEIVRTLDSLRGKVTVVLIAHRLNTIKSADTVYVVENGIISDSGKFTDVANRNPRITESIAFNANPDKR
jgi:ATP-binding cassette subfamily C protein